VPLGIRLRKTRLFAEVRAEPQWTQMHSTISETTRPSDMLMRSHRPALDECDLLNAEYLRDKAMLHAHVVSTRNLRIAAAVKWRDGIARRGMLLSAAQASTEAEAKSWVKELR
jgi:hypothetical protein